MRSVAVRGVTSLRPGGVSTRRVDGLVNTLGIEGISRMRKSRRVVALHKEAAALIAGLVFPQA